MKYWSQKFLYNISEVLICQFFSFQKENKSKCKSIGKASKVHVTLLHAPKFDITVINTQNMPMCLESKLQNFIQKRRKYQYIIIY